MYGAAMLSEWGTIMGDIFTFTFGKRDTIGVCTHVTIIGRYYCCHQRWGTTNEQHFFVSCPRWGRVALLGRALRWYHPVPPNNTEGPTRSANQWSIDEHRSN